MADVEEIQYPVDGAHDDGAQAAVEVQPQPVEVPAPAAPQPPAAVPQPPDAVPQLPANNEQLEVQILRLFYVLVQY